VVSLPQYGEHPITLRSLANHTSGLPRDDPAFTRSGPYSLAQLHQFVTFSHLSASPGEKFQYSNIGVALLGEALSVRTDTPYESLILSRVCEPLGMHDTKVILTEADMQRFAVPHDASLSETECLHSPLPGDGRLHSTARDLLTLLEAHCRAPASPLDSSLWAAWNTRARNDRGETGLCWGIVNKDGLEIVCHDGATYGSLSFIAFAPAKRTGVVVLNNSYASMKDIALHLLDERSPLKKPTPFVRRSIDLAGRESVLFDRYAGEYELSQGSTLTISHEGRSLMVRGDNGEKYELFPESESSFFGRFANARIIFESDDHGRVYGLRYIHEEYIGEKSELSGRRKQQ
jgi:serine-type D-Ala-D-Ala carboxypeptidase/endopeptidase